MYTKNVNVDMVIIGGGPAGIAAGIYAAMDRTNFLLVEARKPCWFMETSVNSHDFVDGFTGIKNNCSGTILRKSFIGHLNRVGGKILRDTVLSLTKKGNLFILKTKGKKIIAKTVIITSGTVPKLLSVSGSKRFNNYIHCDCVAEGAKYIGKNVVVIGGRNSGAVAASYLHDLGCKVSLIEIKSELQAKEKYINNLTKRKIKIYTSAILRRLMGGNNLKRIQVNIAGMVEKIEADGIFVYIGRKVLADYIKIKIGTDEDGYVVVNIRNQTTIEGLYAAGDVTPKLKQIITACGDGANAYYFANKYIKELS